MKQLLKIYCKDFALNSSYLYLLVWILSLTIKYITNNAEYLSTILFTFFACFYLILFLFSYPLTKCLKWILYTPTPKFQIVIFNIIFQLYKIFIISLLFMTLKVILHFVEPQESIVNLDKLHELSVNSNLLSIPLFESSILFGIILFITFILAITFSISPQLIIENRNSHGGIKYKDYNYLLAKYKKYLWLLIPIFILLRLLHGYWSSPLFIVSSGIAYVIFATIYSYSERLIFSLKMHKRILWGGFILLVFNMIVTYSYSHYRLKNTKLSLSNQINEIVFQQKFFSNFNSLQLIKFIESPINGRDLISLMELYNYKIVKNSPTLFHRFPQIEHDLKNDLNFKKIISNKKELSGLQASLGLFSLDQLSFEEIDDFISKWDELNKIKKRGVNPQYLAEMLKRYPFKKEHLIKLLLSKNQTKQFIAIYLTPHFPKYQMQEEILRNVLDFNTDILFMASKTISKVECRTISSVEMIQNSHNKERISSLSQSHCPMKKE